jgi:hypothetical protein
MSVGTEYLSGKRRGQGSTTESRLKVKDNEIPTGNSSQYKSEDMEI